ncbi:signal transduction histidine kinase/DNA-binding response OmpR family regulator [Paraburkholderia bannensis]|uniref:histidine kinase n=1 Tax=Paraburkholderia bannensis TaxID=765414 RepID=A0A7W9WUH6_9BURK|nr:MULTISPECIES: ATP-binding protein [Paraburkholderia]MBB3259381.1 signal transduction histidine kinase/DNA-binding response OmpR family regulator [Paraburkholderia sp. WP4_3_2]MBB6104397.1 signal transduction histidine kinase/DNA-binding response OmpR family regulator [Paraburkholderia bannensis]
MAEVKTTLNAEPDNPFGFLPVHGEMARRVRSLDWTGTSLGGPADWPPSLRAALSLCLSSRFPIVIWWGSDYSILYNDAYIPFLGKAKHPVALGQPGRECWSEIWPTIGPMLEGVTRKGKAVWSNDGQYFFDRDLPREEVYVTFTYGPILAADGRTVEGVFCPCTETTERVVSARRLETLRMLGVRAPETTGIVAACKHVTGVLAQNRHDVPFAIVYRCHSGSSGSSGPSGPSGSNAGETRFEQLASTGLDEASAAHDPAAWPLDEVLRTGRAVDVDLAARGLETPGGAWPEVCAAARALPLRWGGDASICGLIVLGVSPRRPLERAYGTFLDLVAGQTGSAVANALAYEQERRRAEALAEIDLAKTAFFSNVSHEFRTPLTLLLGPLEDALAQPEAPWPRERVEMLHRNTLRLQKLVNSLLDFSRIEAGRERASFAPTDLARLTTDLASAFRSAIERAGLRLLVDCPPLPEPIYVDRDMYEKIVLNLVSNAFKFTLDGEIEVKLRDAGLSVELTVRDTGTGIVKAQLPHIFERFHRIEGARARTHEGTGIGLALVLELVKLHAGTVSVNSTPGQGSTFTVAIPKGRDHLAAERIEPARDEDAPPAATPAVPPAAPAAARHYVEEAISWLALAERAAGKDAQLPTPPLLPGAAEAIRLRAAAPPVASPAPQRPRIVWVDDNADMSRYVARLLAPLYDVETLNDGAAALASVRRAPPALLLADVMMPGLDGFALLRALRHDASTRTIPVILLSARAGEQAQIEGMQAGADDYLVKPFSARELLARVDAHVRLARQREQANVTLRASEKRLLTIIEHLPAGVGVMDLSGKWTLSNAVMKRWLPGGIPSMQADQLARWRAWDPQGNPLAPDDWPGRRALRGETVMPGIEMHYTDEHAEQLWMRSSAAPLRDGAGRVIGACVVVQDVTQLKSAEQALREADRRKDEFLATLAHELRNPLAPIRNGLHILRLAGAGSAAAQRTHDMLERQLDHMVRLVDDLMEVSRITGGKIGLRKEAVELGSVLRQAVETSRALIDAAGHRLTVSVPPEPLVLDADPVRLCQVVANLLNNAAKYTDPGGQIWLTAYGESDGLGSSAVVSIRDNGMGIAAPMLSKVFDLFIQGERTYSRAQGGLGIGLTLVRSLVELHGGSVEARSDGLGRGSEFVVRLPMAAAARADETGERPALPAHTLVGRNILIVDDNRDAADSLGVLLELLGAQVRIVRDGKAALAMFDSWPPDVVLLDIGMPGMDGYEVARRARAHPASAAVLLIALTGWGQDEDRRRSKEAGIDFHLVKPVDMRALHQLLLAQAGRRRG